MTIKDQPAPTKGATYKIKSYNPALAMRVLLEIIDEYSDMFAERKPGVYGGIGATATTGERFYVYQTKTMWVVVQDEVSDE